MPRVVDPAERRQKIFEAVFDVIVESGIEQVTLRAVADAAGLAIGSVRHYFSSHEELLRAAADEVIVRITSRLESHRDRLAGAEDRSSIAEDMLCELLPLTERTSREVVVWLEIVTAGRTNPVLREPAERLYAGSRVLAELIVTRGRSDPPDDVAVEAERLAALIDGLALRMTLDPGKLSAATARAVVRSHLNDLLLARKTGRPA